MNQLGIYFGVVSHTKDPEQRQRVRAKVPQLSGDSPQPWALPAFPGSRVPAIGEEVWIFFAGGDPHSPVYVSSP
ncbi:phage baseplate assembly protein V [Streptomyces sp. WZ-12]|uniref:phage baseplate assembly protein V n=1 Tax=Streptomyces sp. WZ-12 TaxID=3030210 RepID=UPI00238153D0|nr:phage baseplate assembly protein V [Streptomyces sp. WZ-12]